MNTAKLFEDFMTEEYGVEFVDVTPKTKPPKKTWWKVDGYMASVREVTDKNKRDSERYRHPGSCYFFETKEEAVVFKVEQLEAAITQAENSLRLAKTRLSNFKKKHTPEQGKI